MNCVFDSIEVNPVTRLLRLRGKLLGQYPIDIRIYGDPEELSKLKLELSVKPVAEDRQQDKEI